MPTWTGYVSIQLFPRYRLEHEVTDLNSHFDLDSSLISFDGQDSSSVELCGEEDKETYDWSWLMA